MTGTITYTRSDGTTVKEPITDGCFRKAADAGADYVSVDLGCRLVDSPREIKTAFLIHKGETVHFKRFRGGDE